MPSQSDIDEEQIHFTNVLTTFQKYAQYSLAANNRRRKDLYTLPKADQDLLEELGYKKKLDDIDEAILVNAEFLRQIVADPEIFGHNVDASASASDGEQELSSIAESVRNGTAQGLGHDRVHGDPRTPSHTHATSHSHSHSHSQSSHSHSHDAGLPTAKKYKPTEFDMDKLRSTIKQFVRDWSIEGKRERDTCYEPMKDALLAHFSDIPPQERGIFRVLVPGAGLGRLAFDIASLGFTCQGNEFSHYMLLSSYFILNRTDDINKHTIYPYVHSLSNSPDRETILRPVTIPDVLPSGLPPNSDFSLVAGDFEEIYGAEDNSSGLHEPHSGQWDAVLTCFFIDTAKNIVNYLRVIHRILSPGGVWINLGPLLWHFENNSTNDPSVDLDLEQLKDLAHKIGFDISNERTIETTYANNPRSMLGYVYKAAFWTATKRC